MPRRNPSVSSPAPLAKVLRIGIVQDGRVVQERLIRAGGDLSIGASARNDVVIPASDLPDRMLLLEHRRKGYVLRIQPGMTGKLALPIGLYTIGELIERGSVQRSGDGWVLPIDDTVRGKVGLGPTTVLFQFVPAPPELAITNRDFRPKLIERDDPVFYGFLGVFTSLAAVAMIYVWNFEPVERIQVEELKQHVQVTLADIPVLDDPDPVVIEPLEDPDADPVDVAPTDDPPPNTGPEEVVAGGGGDPAEPDPGPPPSAGGDPDYSDAIANNELMQAFMGIGTRGDNNNGERISDIFGEEDVLSGDLDEALDGIVGTEAARTGPTFIAGDGGGGGRGDADLPPGEGDGLVDVGLVGVHDTLIPTIEPEPPEIDTETDDSAVAIKKVIRRYQGQIKYCYEQALNRDSTTSGRVEVSIDIFDGVVEDVHVVGNQTGDTKLAACVESKIRRWQFGAGVDGGVIYPFVVTPKGG